MFNKETKKNLLNLKRPDPKKIMKDPKKAQYTTNKTIDAVSRVLEENSFSLIHSIEYNDYNVGEFTERVGIKVYKKGNISEHTLFILMHPENVDKELNNVDEDGIVIGVVKKYENKVSYLGHFDANLTPMGTISEKEILEEYPYLKDTFRN